MKDEQKQFLGFLFRIFLAVVFASLYAIGGSGDFWGGQLWLRRWLAPFLLCGGGFAISRDWRSIVFYPLMAGALCLPYGADSTGMKIFLRLIFGLANGVAFNGYNLWTKKWIIIAVGVPFIIFCSVAFGVWNPFANAILEQGFIGLVIALPYVMGLKRRL